MIAVKLAQTIEQGLGRGVRGEKDYCAIVITGAELVKAIRSRDSRRYFSQQTRTQVEIGLEIAELAKEEIRNGVEPKKAFIGLISQLLKRDDGWKEFYTDMMNSIKVEKRSNKVLSIFEMEKNAEIKYTQGNYQGAVETIQELIDKHISSEEEKGWYLQEMARYIYPSSKSESNKFQISAHKKNHYLLKPKEGMEIFKISTISLKRIEGIIKWIQRFDNFEELQIALDDTLNNLRFGVIADRFEQAFDELAKALGFVSQRPDKEWKEGPDNLWKVRDNEYLLVECKNKVELHRSEINKDETGQLNNAYAWFRKNYGDVSVKCMMIIPTKKVNSATGFNCEVEVIRDAKLRSLVGNVRKFYMEFKSIDLNDLSDKKIQELLKLHKLTVDDILTQYSEGIKVY